MSKYKLALHISILLIFLTAFSAPPSQARIIQFSGYDWQVRDEEGGHPGPNNWSSDNVWLDSNGDLHLKITYSDNQWYAAEIQTVQPLGFGKYQFQLVGRVDQMDPNVVLGLFSYSDTNSFDEVDIEYTQWGDPESTSGNWSVYSAQPDKRNAHKKYPLSLDGTYTTSQYTWSSDQILFQTLGGHQDDNDNNELASWLFDPSNAENRIPQQPMIVHINFWLNNGNPPLNGEEAEIIIHSFSFIPN